MGAVESDRDIASWLAERRILVGDGATGTMLQAAGLGLGERSERWNLERPDVVESVMRAYRDAGAELLETKTFGANPWSLKESGLAERCAEINRAGAEIGKRAAGNDALVVGSIGPSGDLLQPLGPLTEDEAFDGFRSQAEALAEGGADALCVETMTDLSEATAATRGAASTGLPVIATMTFEPTPRGPFTMMGVDIAAAAPALEAAGANLIGSNCGVGPEAMLEVAREFRSHTRLPVIVQPNAGLPEIIDGQARYAMGPKAMAAFVAPFVAAGVRVIGACCGSTPEHVRAIARAIRELRPA